jgi:hypothetical protein
MAKTRMPMINPAAYSSNMAIDIILINLNTYYSLSVYCLRSSSQPSVIQQNIESFFTYNPTDTPAFYLD